MVERLVQNMPIRHKMFLINSVVATTLFLIAAVFFIIFERESLKKGLVNNLQSIGNVTAYNTVSALQFNDQRHATDTLAALKANNEVIAARLSSTSHKVFAEFSRDTASLRAFQGFSWPNSESAQPYFADTEVYVRIQLTSGGEQLGELVLVGDLTLINEQLQEVVEVAILMLLVALTGGAVLTGWLQRVITKPLFSLVKLTDQVRESSRFSLRAEKISSDEVGTLVDAFNQMLEQLEVRDRELSLYRDSLEGLVEERTNQLTLQTEDLISARDQAQAASRAKSEFLANMSHEIRTPMNGIIGMTELTLNSGLTEDQKEYLSAVHQCANSLMTILNEILDFSKVEAGMTTLECHDFNLIDLIRDINRLLAPRAYEAGLEFVINIPPSLPNEITGDSTRIRQVLINLLSNAIKFTHRGYVTLKLTYEQADDSFGAFTFNVIDTGIGLSEEQLGVIFDAFSQADSTTTRRYGGTGLGLTISRSLIALMGGEISVSSTPGQGSTFTFTLNLPVRDSATTPNTVLQNRDHSVVVLALKETINEVLSKHFQASGVPLIDLSSMSDLPSDTNLVIVTEFTPLVKESSALLSSVKEFLVSNTRAVSIIMLTSPYSRFATETFPSNVTVTVVQKPVMPAELVYKCVQETEKLLVKNTSTLAHTNKGAPVSKSNGLTILVAEDNIVNQMLVKKILEASGHKVIIADNGLEACDALEQFGAYQQNSSSEKVDIVLMDIQMPLMSGVEAATAIRKREVGLSTHIPIIALTAHAMPGHREEYLSAGMDGYVTKPIHRQTLLDTIKDLTKSK